MGLVAFGLVQADGLALFIEEHLDLGNVEIKTAPRLTHSGQTLCQFVHGLKLRDQF